MIKKIFFISIISFFFSNNANAQLAIGEIAPDIKLPDSAGKWKPLSEVKAKIILLDFWAAWCYPCVQYLPDLKRIYEKYHDKGLAVYAVSLDRGYYNWINMCKKQELPFILVNDPYSFEGKACKEYHITSIPNKILIKEGKIFGIDMSLYDLEKMIEKELSN